MGADEAVKPGRDKGAVVAVVVEERPALIFEVLLPSVGRKILAHLAGTVERNFVRLVPGDKVEVELSPHDPTRGKILRKMN